MAHAPARHGVGGGAFFVIFWRFSAVFDPILEGTRRFFTANDGLDAVQIPRPTANGPLLAHISAYSGVWRF